ncbi:ABC transporter permease [Actinomadura rupiterrae]|uniref:ABC transporter permease n=1 Tax=Actinomadura rupiterrae TaxID=559627 RepID=UPI0020A507F2|nr:ABC transporter permease [Actinomadura rupiterrae]MCP2343749.1 oleandomycin transport system permease protein [Actinomadura rupiterrae]
MTTMTTMTGTTAHDALPPARISLRRTVRHSLTLAWRNIAQLRHSPEKLIDVTLMPLVFLVLFLYVFGGAVAGSTHAYLQQLLPGLVAQMAMFATMGLGTALSEDIRKGVFDRFRSLPIARSAPLIGTVVGDTVRFLTVVVVLSVAGTALGFRFGSDPLRVLAGFALAYVFYLAFSWISVMVGLIAPSPETVQGLAFMFVMPLTFGSSVFVANTSTMPGWLETWTKMNPVSHLTDALRALLVGGPVGNHVWITLAWAVGIVTVTFPIAMRMYARRA